MWLRISRETSLRLGEALDSIVPPLVRDSKVFMWPMMRLLFGEHAREFMQFKARAFTLTPEEFKAVYARTGGVMDLQGDTDLNRRCIDEVVRSVIGPSVLEVGCGRGYLAGLLSDNHRVTACDILLPTGLAERYPKVTFQVASLDRLPYEDSSFDTVVCTHTLEHVQSLQVAIAELRRVTRRRLILVVPRQRPYRYTFSLHLHFFPYDWCLQSVLGGVPGATLRNLGDWYYSEDRYRQVGTRVGQGE